MNQQSNVVVAASRFSDQAESRIIEAVKAGDMQAYEQLYQRHVGRVYALCLRLTADRALAEDATQEVFIQLWRKLDNYAGQSKFSTWLHSVASNVAISYMRKQKSWWQRMFDIEDVELKDERPAQPGHQRDLELAMQQLPEKARIVFVLHGVEGYRHEDIAEMLGIATGTSKAQYHRAKQLLREWMGHE